MDNGVFAMTFFTGLLAGLMLTVILLTATDSMPDQVMRNIHTEAVEAGAAYYECSPATGECVFTWGVKQ